MSIPDTDAVMSLLPAAEVRDIPFAIVDGEHISEPPRDLYIPPQAMQVFHWSRMGQGGHCGVLASRRDSGAGPARRHRPNVRSSSGCASPPWVEPTAGPPDDSSSKSKSTRKEIGFFVACPRRLGGSCISFHSGSPHFIQNGRAMPR